MSLNRLQDMKENNDIASAIVQLGREIDEYKTTAQLQGGTGGLRGLPSATGNEWDIDKTYVPTFSNVNNYEIVFRSATQEKPILNPFVVAMLNDYVISATDFMTNSDNGVSGGSALEDISDPDEPFVQRYRLRFLPTWNITTNYRVRVRAGANGSDICTVEVIDRSTS